MKNKKNSGFTMVEVLLAVTILVILLAVTAVSTINYSDMLRLTELDNAAREIYLAAENRAVLLSSAQMREDISTYQARQLIVPFAGAPVLTLAEEYNDLEVLDKDESLSLLLSSGNIESSLEEGNFYIVRSKANGSVTDVFYAEGNALPEKEDFWSFYNGWDSDSRLNGDQKTFIGYYGVKRDGAAQSAETPPALPEESPNLEVTITNDVELKVEVKLAGTFSDAVGKAFAPDGNLTVMLCPADGTDNGVELTGGYDPATSTYTWTLDDLNGKKFSDIVNEDIVTRGDNFRVVATLTSPYGEFAPAYASDVNNSLFAKGSGKDATDKYTAVISNLRHLQNLNEVDFKLSAIQKGEIDGNNYTGYEYVPIDNSDGHIQSYDGLGHAIKNLTITADDAAAGLFSESSNVELKNIRLDNVTVSRATAAGGLVGMARNTSISNCYVTDTAVTGTNAAGGLVGEADGTTITGCRVYWSDPAELKEENDYDYKIDGQRAGGLVGEMRGTTNEIGSSLAATTVRGTIAAGGLVGQKSGSLTVTGSYADCYLNGGTYAAGLVGFATGGSVSLTDCYAAGFIVGGTNTAGLCNGSVTAATTYSVMLCPTDDEENPFKAPKFGLANGLVPDGTVTFLGVDDAGNTGLSSAELGKIGGETGATFTAFVNTGKFEAKDDEHTTAYKLQSFDEDWDWTTYPYPGLKGLPHYGDWGALETESDLLPAGLVYYEWYSGNTLGIYGYNMAGEIIDALEDRSIYSTSANAGSGYYGYGVLFKDSDISASTGTGTIKVTSGGTEYTATITKSGTSITGKWAYGSSTSTPQIRAGDGFYVIPLPDALGNNIAATTLSGSGYYTSLTIEGSSKTYYYNPQFAKMMWLEAPNIDDYKYQAGVKPKESFIIRAYQHLLNLRTVYFSKGFNFLQEKDVNISSAGGSVYIGSKTEPFNGLYDGGGYTITAGTSSSTLSGSNVTGAVGLFCWNTGTIQNLKVSSYVVSAYSNSNNPYTGGVVGYNQGKVINCSHTGGYVYGGASGSTNTNYPKYVGGVVGYNAAGGEVKVTDGGVCYNSVAVMNNYSGTKESATGGIIGFNAGTFTVEAGGKCYNSGAVTGNNTGTSTPSGSFLDGTGGIIGCTYYGKISVSGECYNQGTVKGNYRIGGVIGLRYYDTTTLANCYNKGTVTGNSSVSGSNQYVGGVVGYNSVGGSPYIPVENCHNEGTVTGTKNYVGGVVGYATGSRSWTKGCYSTSTAKVQGTNYVGGVVGYAYASGQQITDSYNEGTVTGSGYYVGGVAGQAGGGAYLTNCHNTGNVSGDSYNVGGVAGSAGSAVTNCYNKGSVTGKSYNVGGVAGSISSTMTGCYNTNSVQGTYSVGGVAGSNSNTVSDSYNTGDVTSTGNSSSTGTGGVVGTSTSTVSTSYNVGKVTASGGNSRGGVVGYSANTENVTYCYYLTGTAENGIGGVADTANKADSKKADNFAALSNFTSWSDTIWKISTPAVRPILNAIPEENVEPLVKGDENVVEIETAEEFQNLLLENDPEKVYKLMDDINMRGASINLFFAHEDYFNSTFDGDGHTIYNFVSHCSGHAGALGNLGSEGTIKNLHLFGEIYGDQGENDYSGGIVARSYGTIENCSFSGKVYGSKFVGGIVGENYGTVKNCYSTATVEQAGASGPAAPSAPGEEEGPSIGGVVGRNRFGGKVENSYNTGAVSGETAGGVVGYNEGSMQYCYNIGKVTGDTVGAVVGNSTGTMTNCYYHSNAGTTAGGGTQLTDDQFRSLDYFSGWVNLRDDDNELVWEIAEGLDILAKRPVLKSNNEKTNNANAPKTVNLWEPRQVTKTVAVSAPDEERVVTLSVGGGIPSNGTWTVSVNGADETVAASFARDEDGSPILMMKDGGGGEIPLYITARQTIDAPVTVSVTYTYTSGDSDGEEEEITYWYSVRPVAPGDPSRSQEWEVVAAMPPEYENPVQEIPEPDDPGPEGAESGD